MLDDDTDLGSLDSPDGLTMPPPFQFEFAVFCPWATSVQVLIHTGGRPVPPSVPRASRDVGDGKHILLEMVRVEGSLWCGEIDLPGKHHTFSYRANAGDRTVIAPFEGGYHPPGTYAKVTARATYPGKRKKGRLCD